MADENHPMYHRVLRNLEEAHPRLLELLLKNGTLQAHLLKQVEAFDEAAADVTDAAQARNLWERMLSEEGTQTNQEPLSKEARRLLRAFRDKHDL